MQKGVRREPREVRGEALGFPDKVDILTGPTD